MSISSYEIELPINKESSYQQLYRGRHENNQVYMLHIFPKQCLTQEMFEQIETRSKQLEHIFEVYDDDVFIMVVYSESTLWINLEQKFKSGPQKNIYSKLYHSYAKIQGIVDFDQELVYLQDESIFIIDYGLRQFVNKRHKDLEYTTKTRSYLFGLLLLNITSGKDLSEKLLQCNDQYAIDSIVHSASDLHKINNEILDYLLRMLKLDPTQRPTFEEIGQWKLFFRKKELQPVSASVVDFLNTKVGQMNSNRQQPKSARPQSQETRELKDPHFQSVKAAVQRQKRQTTSQSKVCSSYIFAYKQVNNNMKRKRQEGGGQINSVQTQQSFFQFTQQTQVSSQAQYPKTQNDFFAYQTQQGFQNMKSSNSQKSMVPKEQQQYPTNNTERKTPFLFEASSPPPPPTSNIISKPQHLSTQPIAPNKQENYNQGANFFSNNQQNLAFQQPSNIPSPVQVQTQKNQQQQNFTLPPALANPNAQKETLKLANNQDNNPQHFKSQPTENNVQPSQASAQPKILKFKTPPVSISRLEDNEIEEEGMENTANFEKKQVQLDPQPSLKKQEDQLKKPQSDPKIVQMAPEKQKSLEDPIQQQQKELKLAKANSQANQNISEIEEPKIIRPNKSNNIEAKPLKPAPPPQPEDSSKQFNEYISQYYSYLAIIQIITHAVSDINEKLSGTNQIWIIPLSIVFKRAYQIRKQVEEDIEKQRNGFGFKEFMKFKQSPQYKQLEETIVQQNKMMQIEFSSMLETAHKNSAKLDNTSKSKMTALLNLDVSKCIKDQAEQYLFTQLYPRVVGGLNKLRAGTLANNKFSELDWVQTRLLSLYALVVMELDNYYCESDLFKESAYLQYRKNQNIDKIEQHCNQIEEKLKQLPKFKK